MAEAAAKKKRVLSKAARARISRAQRARWSAWRKNGKPTYGKATHKGDDPGLVEIVKPALTALDKQIANYQDKIKTLQGLSKALLHLQRL